MAQTLRSFSLPDSPTPRHRGPVPSRRWARVVPAFAWCCHRAPVGFSRAADLRALRCQRIRCERFGVAAVPLLDAPMGFESFRLTTCPCAGPGGSVRAGRARCLRGGAAFGSRGHPLPARLAPRGGVRRRAGWPGFALRPRGVARRGWFRPGRVSRSSSEDGAGAGSSERWAASSEEVAACPPSAVGRSRRRPVTPLASLPRRAGSLSRGLACRVDDPAGHPRAPRVLRPRPGDLGWPAVRRSWSRGPASAVRCSFGGAWPKPGVAVGSVTRGPQILPRSPKRARPDPPGPGSVGPEPAGQGQKTDGAVGGSPWPEPRRVASPPSLQRASSSGIRGLLLSAARKARFQAAGAIACLKGFSTSKNIP
jgi:hypothetical protein